MITICPECGQENRDLARFCRLCGARLAKVAHQAEASAEPPDEQSPGSPPAPHQDQAPETASETKEEIEPGQVLIERFLISSTVSTDSDGTIYLAEDLLRCWNCLAEQPTAAVDYCESCGAALDHKAVVHLKASRSANGDPLQADPLSFFDRGSHFEVELPVLEKEAPASTALRQISAYRSHPGLVRENNEDSLIALSLAGQCDPVCAPPMGFYAIADGVGGADSGEIASRTAVYTLASEVIQRIFLPELAEKKHDMHVLGLLLRELVQSANQAILDKRSQVVDSEMGCTLTAVLIRDRQAIVINVGDSRTYHLRQGQLIQVTQDHSMIAQLVEQGFIQPEDIAAQLQRSVIYRSLGNQPEIPIDIFNLELEAGERLLLCSDGLWEMVPATLIEEILLDRLEPHQACDRLIEFANLAGGDDNISVIVISLSL